ncbi:MAG: bifunctional glutamate N-acetyltransferase/amino-acid acetyltransferase ArgJ, partial [Chloroflexi bacterium]|nr:bifunctional glutamate N-acetyltransferase/amino-acid acetyltransferase ArgJ [Chloroflexota bacterium]
MKTARIDPIDGGTVTTPKGFYAGATYAGIKKKNKDVLDLCILFSEEPCTAAALFTTNKIKSAPVLLCQQRLQNDRAVAIIANSGCANASTGEQGLADAAEMTALAADSLGTAPEDVLVASTGVIGQPLPMKLIKAGISQIVLSSDGGHELARAIMTTDTVPKEIAVRVKTNNGEFTIGGVAKGSGMIHPNLATMFCFLTTDAAVEPDFLKSALRRSAGISFNMISVDTDTSPSDTVLLMANGLAGNKPISKNSQSADAFRQALEQVCVYLAKAIARDGEGATKLIEVTVNGAVSPTDAKLAARTVVSSPLVKTAVHGADPNWGRILAALGRSGAEVVESKIDLYIGKIGVVKGGSPLPYREQDVVKVFKQKEVPVNVYLNLGKASATAWGCDLSKEYVTINS